jgi:tRNA U34 2-thiouridine synthase MnmA/TrmU
LETTNPDSPTGEYNKTEIYKMAARRFVEVTDKEISEIKINSVPKNTKDLCKNTKTIYIRLRISDYGGIFPDNYLAFGE